MSLLGVELVEFRGVLSGVELVELGDSLLGVELVQLGGLSLGNHPPLHLIPTSVSSRLGAVSYSFFSCSPLLQPLSLLTILCLIISFKPGMCWRAH